VSDVVDPNPIIEERLKVLAAEHEPGIAILKRAVANGEPGSKSELRRAKRAYRLAALEVEKLRGPGAAW
jgi:hypothetical protein